MATIPISRQPLLPENRDDAGIPVLTLKQLVARLQREQVKIRELLVSLSFALRSFNNLNQFFELIPLIAGRVTDADAAALVLFKANGQISLEQLHCHAADYCPNIRATLERVTRHISGSAVIRDSKPQQLDLQLQRDLGDMQCFGTPILVKNSEYTERGRLYVFSQSADYEWTDTRQQLIQVVADQTAVAIENDELTIALRNKERLDRELEIGAEIQERLFPSQCPQIPGVELAANCRTASRVGGDYYDFIPITYGQPNANSDAKRWGLVIGDVMGKGVPAGLLMTMTRGMLRAEVLNGHRPGRILQHLNRVMHADLENSNRFVTLFYSEYNPLTQILSYSNAAHHPPLLWQSATNTVKRLDTYGMLIGLDSQSQYQEAEVRLLPGDTIIFYTDGFTDATNPQGDRFELENLTQAFIQSCHTCQTPQAILDSLFRRVQDFIGPHEQNSDDMTLIVLQIKPAD